MRFLADENISALIVQHVRALGFEVSVISEHSSGICDKDVLQMAENENLFLITEDRDFGELVIRQKRNVRGVILTELDRLTTLAEAERVAKSIAENQDQLTGHLMVIEPGRIRFRPLDPDVCDRK